MSTLKLIDVVLEDVSKQIQNSLVLKLSFSISLLVVIFVLWSRRRFYILSMNLPGPLSLPLFGNVLHMKIFTKPEDLMHVLSAWKKQYGDLFCAWLGPELAVVMSEPEDIKCVLLSRKSGSKGPRYELLKIIGGDGLLVSSGDLWRHRRNILNPSFNKNVIKSFFVKHNEHSKRLVDSLLKSCDSGLVEVSIYCSRYCADIITETLFDGDHKFYEGKHDDILKASPTVVNIAYKRMCKVWLWNDFIFKRSSIGKTFAKNVKLYKDYYKPYFIKKINERIDNYNSSTVDEIPKNCLDVMIDAVIDGKMTPNEIINEFYNIYKPGVETLKSSLSHFIMMMGMYKRCQDKAWREIKEVFGNNMDAEITPEHLPKLKYVEMCLKENTRLHPTGVVLMRSLEDDMELPHRNTILPKGLSVVINLFGLHRNEKYWSEPNKFIPERFSPEITAERPTFAFLPFSAGARNCIGQIFGYDTLKVAIVYLLRNLEFHTDLTHDQYILEGDVSTKSILGHHVTIKKRDRHN